MNWLAHILAAVSAMGVGFAWYHPKTFGTSWMQSVGLTERELEEGNLALRYGLALFMAFMASILIGFIIQHPDENLSAWMHGAFHGGQIAAYFGLPVLIINALFEQMSFKHIAITAGYWVVTLAVMGAILGAMS